MSSNSSTSMARKLALAIAHCPEVSEALRTDSVSCCSEIVQWQMQRWIDEGMSPSEAQSRLHRPEPWAGNLETARILFLSSNPSFDVAEDFPDGTSAWTDDRAGDFFVGRFVNRGARDFGALDGPQASDQDRVLRRGSAHGVVVPHWRKTRNRAAAILGTDPSDTLASRDYVMTEVVHCKSQTEAGVNKALSLCAERWLLKTLELSPARLVVVSGSHAGRAVKQALSAVSGGSATLPATWGKWGKSRGLLAASGVWPKSWDECEAWNKSGRWSPTTQSTHTVDVELQIAGNTRSYLFVWLPHPTASVPQTLSRADLIDPKLLERWRSVALA